MRRASCEEYERRGILAASIPSSRSITEGVGELVQHRGRARPAGAPRPQARHLRRAWRRSGLDPLLRTTPASTTSPARPTACRSRGWRRRRRRWPSRPRRMPRNDAANAILQRLKTGGKRALAGALAATRTPSRSGRQPGAARCRLGAHRAPMSLASPARRASASRRWPRRWSRLCRKSRPDGGRDRRRSVLAPLERRRAARRSHADRPRSGRRGHLRALDGGARPAGRAGRPDARGHGADARALRRRADRDGGRRPVGDRCGRLRRHRGVLRAARLRRQPAVHEGGHRRNSPPDRRHQSRHGRGRGPRARRCGGRA